MNSENSFKEVLRCIECHSEKDTRTANGIPVCNGCISIWRQELKEYEKNKKLMPEIDEIIRDKLYLGNYDQAKIKEDLKKRNVSHILVCGSGLDIFFPNDFIYEKFELEDIEEQDLKPFIMPAINFIEKGGIVFVHCHAGVSRSASIVISYIMYKLRLPFEMAFGFVKNKRNCIFPHTKFRNDLMELEEQILE